MISPFGFTSYHFSRILSDSALINYFFFYLSLMILKPLLL